MEIVSKSNRLYDLPRAGLVLRFTWSGEAPAPSNQGIGNTPSPVMNSLAFYHPSGYIKNFPQ